MSWSSNENRRFEQALAAIEADIPERWQLVAQAVGGGRTADDAWHHYLRLNGDIGDMAAMDRLTRRRQQYLRNAQAQQHQHQHQHGADADANANANGTAANNSRNYRPRSNGGGGASSSNSNNNRRANNNRPYPVAGGAHGGVLGLSPHSDAVGLTLLLVCAVPGLQIRRRGAWVSLDPIPGALGNAGGDDRAGSHDKPPRYRTIGVEDRLTAGAV